MEINIVVFAGGLQSSQCGPFHAALGRLQEQLKVKENGVEVKCLILYNRDLRVNDIDQHGVIHMLAQSDIHIILSHLHQGNGDWNISQLLADLMEKLSSHRGWPSGDNLSCPIFTQNKFKYIESCRELFLPTLAINFDESTTMLDEANGAHIVDFMRLHTEGNGWVVKLPYHTNGVGLHFCKDPQAVFDAIRILSVGYANAIYCMLQPCLANRKEYKVILLGGTARYVADIKQRGGLGEPFSMSPHTDILCLAEKAGELLEARCLGANIHPILRVDVMQSKNGYVVNEFEGLEACYYATKVDLEFHTYSFLEEFWFITLQSLINEHIGNL